MKKQLRTFGFLLSFMFVLGAVYGQNQSTNVDIWPETAKKAAKAMMDKYGQPDEQTESRLMWKNTGAFTHTIVYKEEIQHDFPMPHKDVLEQVINYDVPADKFDDLAEYDGSVLVERTKATMAARCDKEAANYLALNLANDVINGDKSVSEARRYYADAIMKMMKGEKEPYLERLTFEAPSQSLNNPDETVMNMSKVKEMKNKQN